MRLETLGAMAALAAAVLTVEQRGNASSFGLVLSYALSITMLTSMTVGSLTSARTWEGWKPMSMSSASVAVAISMILVSMFMVKGARVGLQDAAAL